MKTLILPLLLVFLNVAGMAQICDLEVTYLANAGYMLRAGDKKVLVDALFDQAMDPYLNHSPETLAKLKKGEAPFDGVLVALATHQHADHFDAATVADFLRNNREAVFIAWNPVADMALKAGAPPQQVRSSATEARESFAVNGVRIEMLRLSHGRARGGDLNVGYIVHIGGKKVFHPGDAWRDPRNFQRVGLPAEHVDIALIPHWYAEPGQPGVAIVQELAPKHTIFIHVPPNELAELKPEAPKSLPGALFIQTPLERRCF